MISSLAKKKNKIIINKKEQNIALKVVYSMNSIYLVLKWTQVGSKLFSIEQNILNIIHKSQFV